VASALLIDDDRQLVETIKSNAAEEGLELDVATSWDEGLALFQTRAPDLVIADYRLPGSRHGLRLLLEVKQLRSAVRIVLISGEVNPDELAKVEELGVVDRVMSKGSAIETTGKLLDEIRAANENQLRPTDWPKAAQSLIEGLQLDRKKVDELDDRMKTDAERKKG
jgi:DNA-binding response OmpR family regulator